jgi:hypothetical protein
MSGKFHEDLTIRYLMGLAVMDCKIAASFLDVQHSPVLRSCPSDDRNMLTATLGLSILDT